MTPFEKIEALIETRINGNSIKGNKTYENMIKSLRTNDFRSYENENFNGVLSTLWTYKKIDKIEIYKNFIIGEK
jgi:hypothetical protein